MGKTFRDQYAWRRHPKKNQQALPGFKEQFCLNTAVWYYLNRLKRLDVLTGKEYKFVQYSENGRTFLSGDPYKVTKGEAILVENSDVLIPELWLEENMLIAYSKSGYKNKIMDLS